MVKEKYRIQDEKDDFERKVQAQQRRLHENEEAIKNLKGLIDSQNSALQERD